MGGCCFSRAIEEQTTQESSTLQADPETSGILISDGVSRLSFSDLQVATKNFSSDEILPEKSDESSSNFVYKGQSQTLGFIAVKRFKTSAWPDRDQFAEEAKRVGKIRHKRVVNTIGYCCHEDERLLVSEFMSNHSLAKHLFHRKSQIMEWPMRLRVAYCIAQALEYCTNAGFESSRNLSAYSVLFDEKGEASLSCFALVKEFGDDLTSVYSERFTFRFGTILLNLLSGKQIPPSIAPEIMIKGKKALELMDPNLEGKFSSEEATILFELASKCLQYEESLSAKDLVATLEALQTKTRVPSFQIPEMAMQHQEASTSRQQKPISPLQNETETPSIEMTDEASSSSQLSPLGEACLRMDLNAIHKILVKTQYQNEEAVSEFSFSDWLPVTKQLEQVRKDADDAFEREDFVTAIQGYSEIIDHYKDETPSLVYARRCLSLLFCDKKEAAFLDVNTLTKVDKEWPTGRYLMSVVVAKSGMHTEHADELKKAISLEQKTQRTMARDEES